MSAGSEILIQISDANLQISEVPITASYDPSTQSTHNPVSHGIEVLGRIIAIISYRRPLPAFGIPGLILFVIGMVATSYALAEYYLTTELPFTLSMVGAILLIIGFLMGIAGLILNAMIVIVRESKEKSKV